MKRTLLALGAVAVSATAMAQTPVKHTKAADAVQLHQFGEDREITRPENTLHAAGKTTAGASRDTLLFEDWSGPSLTTNGWSQTGKLGTANSNKVHWSLRKGAYTDTGSLGGCNFITSVKRHGRNPVNSPSRANGFVIFDSDYLMDSSFNATCGGSGGIQGAHIGKLISPVIDMSTSAHPRLEFYQDFRQFHSDTYILWSIDGGLTYGADTILVNTGIGVNDATDNSYGQLRVLLNLDTLANKSNVKIAFVYDATSAQSNPNNFGRYYWMVDDISVFDAPDFDVALFDVRVQSDSWLAFYAQVPKSEIDSIRVGATFANYGGMTTPVAITGTVKNGGGTTVFTGTGNGGGVPPTKGDGRFVQFTSNAFLPTTLGTYNFTADLSTAPNTDADNTNDSARTQKFILSDSVYAIDQNVTTNLDAVGTQSFTGANSNFITANLFTLVRPDTITSITIRINRGSTNPGSQIVLSIRQADTSTFNFTSSAAVQNFQANAISSIPIATTDPNGYTITSLDTADRFITLSLLPGNPLSQLVLPAGAYYAVAQLNPVGFTADVSIADDKTVTQPIVASIIGIANATTGNYQYFTNGNALFIRANFGHFTQGSGAGIAQTASPVAQITAYPNPTAGNTTLSYSLNTPGNVAVNVMDATGRNVISQNLGYVNLGVRTTTLATDKLANGVYTYSLTANGATTHGKLVVNR